MATLRSHNFGWQPDLPDHRDYTPEHEEALGVLRQLKPPRDKGGASPDRIDWREYCPPVADQENLAASTAHACVAMVQYCERRASGRVPCGVRANVWSCHLRHRLAGAAGQPRGLRAVSRTRHFDAFDHSGSVPALNSVHRLPL